MNSEPNTSQNHVSNINIMWQKLGLKLCKKLSQTHLVLKTIEEISTYFYQLYMCGNITKTIKNISRTHCNFLGIFARNFSMHRGPNIRNVGATSKKNKEKTEKKREQGHRPKPVPQVHPDHS